MQLFNRFTVLTKRILAHKIYMCMLVAILFLTVVYKLLPAKSQSADIKVAVCSKDTGDYTERIFDELAHRNTLYTFYDVPSQDALLRDVKSGYAECGFFFPDGFFTDYIQGISGVHPMILYKTPSAMLSATIAETVFSVIYRVCAEEILLYTTQLNEQSHREDMISLFRYYTDSDEVYQMETLTEGTFSFQTIEYRIKLPVLEITLLLLLFSGLLGLLLFQQDKERGIYLALSRSSLLQIKSLSVATALLPMLATGLACARIVYMGAGSLITLLAGCFIIFFVTMLLSLVIRKSTLLAKVLPLIMLSAILGVFINTLL